MSETPVIKTRLPYCYYFWLGLNIFLTGVFIFYNNILEAAIYESVFGFLSYTFIARYACRVTLTSNKIVARYPFPLMQTKAVDFEPSDLIKYELGYYYYFNDEHSLSRLQLINPQDQLSFYKSKDKAGHFGTLYINTRYKDFNTLKKVLDKTTNTIKSYDTF